MRLQLMVLVLIADVALRADGEYTIPEFLLECYSSSTPIYPLTMSNFLDIIRKLELLPGVTYDAASLSSLLFHRFTLDGVERDPNISPSYQYGVVPFKLSGVQKYRDAILKRNLLPADFFYPPHALTHVEKCSLHMMMSSSVDLWERGDEYLVCPKLKQQKQWYTDEQYGTKMSSCPIEMGVVHTRDEAISPNRIISAVLAALRPTYMQVEWGNRSEPQQPLSSLWASTLAGDLASVVVWQNEDDHTMASSGYWNDTAIPTNYYLMETYATVANRKWQMTKSQLLADIDGLTMALEIERNKNLRLSQLLETFYSSQSRCRRKLFFTDNIRPRIQQLRHQTMLFAKLLRSQCPVCYYQNDTALASNVNQAVLELQSNADEYLQVQDCNERHRWPRVRLNIIFDSTFLPYAKLQFFMKLAETLDVSYFGSRMTLVNGQTGSVVISDATNTGQVYSAWRNTTHYDRDVKYLELSRSLISLDGVLRSTERRVVRADEAAVYSHVTLVVALSSTLQTRDLHSLTSVLNNFIYTHPEQRLVYLSTPLTRNVFEALGGYYRDRERNQIVDFHVNQPLDSLVKHILAVQRSIVPGRCDSYQSPGQPTVFKYHQTVKPNHNYNYIIETSYIDYNRQHLYVQLFNGNNGDLEICMRSRGKDKRCQYVGAGQQATLTVNNINDIDHLRNGQLACRNCSQPVYIDITSNHSLYNCQDVWCRSVDEVWFQLGVDGLLCKQFYGNVTKLLSSAGPPSHLTLSITATLLFVLIQYILVF